MFAVAGSGKTTYILESLCDNKRALIITYANNNLQNLRDGLLKKYGYFPSNISIMSYYNFLYSFCYRPFLSRNLGAKGINWNPNPNTFTTNDGRYIDRYKRLYSNRIAKLIEIKDALKDVNDRISKYFDTLYIDEIQDFAGNDFNFLKSIVKSKIDILFVGDFYQHTYDTGRDGKVNSSLHDDYADYKKKFTAMGLMVDHKTLLNSHRCSPAICDFIKDHIGILIASANTEIKAVKIIDTPNDAAAIWNDNSIVKLFYQEHYKYGCFSRNWGDCKGENKYQDVCVVLNTKTWDFYQKQKLRELPSQTKNKLYVACSRARGNLFLVSDKLFKQFKQ